MDIAVNLIEKGIGSMLVMGCTVIDLSIAYKQTQMFVIWNGNRLSLGC
jgi:hypothetical protein